MLRSKTPYILFVLTAFWLGCAVQNSLYTQKRAEELLKLAQADNPEAPETKVADAKLCEAKWLQTTGRSDRVEKVLRESIEASERIIQKSEAEKAEKVAEQSAAAAPAVSPQAETPKVETISPQAEVKEPVAKSISKEVPNKPESLKSEGSKKGMPAKALAKYLASKHALKSAESKATEPKPVEPKKVETQRKPAKSETTKTVAPAENAAPTEQDIPSDQALEAGEPATEETSKMNEAKKSEEVVKTSAEPARQTFAPASPQKEIEKPAQKAETSTSKPAPAPKEFKVAGGSGDGKSGLAIEEGGVETSKSQTTVEAKAKTVNAPAAKTNKKAPERKNEAVEEKFVAAPKESEQSKNAAKVLAKRRIPGSIEFKVNDPSLQTDAMTNLDQTSKFLLDNPSMTLVVQSIAASGEATTLADSRYESIRSYLTAKGVPDDQIRLEPERKTGRSPEFELFLIEH